MTLRKAEAFLPLLTVEPIHCQWCGKNLPSITADWNNPVPFECSRCGAQHEALFDIVSYEWASQVRVLSVRSVELHAIAPQADPHSN